MCKVRAWRCSAYRNLVSRRWSRFVGKELHGCPGKEDDTCDMCTRKARLADEPVDQAKQQDLHTLHSLRCPAGPSSVNVQIARVYLRNNRFPNRLQNRTAMSTAENGYQKKCCGHGHVCQSQTFAQSWLSRWTGWRVQDVDMPSSRHDGNVEERRTESQA